MRQKLASRDFGKKTGRAAFVTSLQVRIAPGGNALAYDAIASGAANYNRARYYDPTIGRFISEDPLKQKAGPNFYAYAGDNPINANDPMGKDPNVPYSSLQAAQIAAGQWTAALTAYSPNPLENGVFIYQLGSSWYHTVAVTSTGLSNQVSSADWQWLWQFVPPGATDVTNAHSHLPPDAPGGPWAQYPSKIDINNSGTTTNVLGLTDGSVLTYTGLVPVTSPDGGTSFVRPTGGPNSAGQNTIQPPTPLPDPYLNNSEPPSMPTASSSLGTFGGAPTALDSAAAGGFLIYPNQQNTNGLQSVYGKQ